MADHESGAIGDRGSVAMKVISLQSGSNGNGCHEAGCQVDVIGENACEQAGNKRAAVTVARAGGIDLGDR